jgi:hypothetical protein
VSNYIKLTDYSVKDGLITGDPDKVVKGTEIDDEFDAIASAIQTKADVVSPTFLGTPTAPTANQSVNNTQIATTAFAKAAALASLQAVYPVGSIYINATNSTNPGTLLGFGTWVAFGAGRVMVGFNASDPLFDSAEETGGSKDAVAVAHTHGFSATTSSNGDHNHIQAYSGHASAPARYGTTSTSISAIDDAFAGGDDTSGPLTSTAGAHTHTVSGTTASTGSSGTNANLPPYITVFMWKRVS